MIFNIACFLRQQIINAEFKFTKKKGNENGLLKYKVKDNFEKF